MNISIQITGLDDVQARLIRLGNSLYKLDNAMRQIGEYLARYYANEAFASQGQVFNETWPRLNSKYSVWKAKNFPGRPPNVRTGSMQQRFAFEAGSSSVRVYNDADYFPYLQLGTSKMPERPMMGFSNANKNMIREIISTEIKAKLASV